MNITELKQQRERLRQLRFDLAAGKLKNVKEISKTKKVIAQILTSMNANAKKKTDR